tara:strand:+ start:660 stop:1775 length:1116 start_codon:yes stop_codon:yes gene_type:complete
MHFITSKEKIFKALNETNKVIPLRTTLPILSCVLIKTKENELILTSTDLEQTIKITIDVKTIKPGEITVSSAKILEIVSALPNKGEINFSTKDDFEIEINSSQGVYKIVGKDPSEYPETPKLNKEQELTIQGQELLSIINNTLYAVSKDDLKPALCGIYLNIDEKNITAVTTDGHRLVKMQKKTEESNPKGSIIVPGKFFTILKNNIKLSSVVNINLSENHISVVQNNQTTISRIIKENFPDFNSVIPEELSQKATVKIDELIAAIKRVSIFSNKTTKQIIINFNNNEMTISTEDKETRSSAKEHIECEYENENLSVAYNSQYIKEVLQNINDKEVEIFFSGALTAAVFKPKTKKDKSDITALLMPLRTQQ